MKTKFYYKVVKETIVDGKTVPETDKKGNPIKPVYCKNKVQKDAFIAHGFKSIPLTSLKMVKGKPQAEEFKTDNLTVEDLLTIIRRQEGKVNSNLLEMTKEQLIQKI